MTSSKIKFKSRKLSATIRMAQTINTFFKQEFILPEQPGIYLYQNPTQDETERWRHRPHSLVV